MGIVSVRSFVLILGIIRLASGTFEQVTLNNNGYEGIVIAINPEITEDPNIVESLKEIWKNASQVLYDATHHRAYFNEITIVVPTSWNNGTYAAAGKVSYDKADVLIAGAHPSYGDMPYTLQLGECGKHGEYIHLTPNYLADRKTVVENFGPKGKVMVHEWAHLRWGVFDNNPTEGYPEFYYGKDNKLEATRSPASIEGEIVHVFESSDDGTIVGEPCVLDPQTGFPPTGECVFVPNEEQNGNINTCMMSFYNLDQVVYFSHDNESDPLNMHNKEAPNEQNRLCGQRSPWDVITSSQDFVDGRNPPTTRTHVEPRFNVVQAKQNKQFVLVLDTSGSMDMDNLAGSDTRMQNAITAAQEFIKNYAPIDSYVGIVDFDSYAKVNSNLKLLHTDTDRENLIKYLPQLWDASGSTNLYAGVDEAVEMLIRSGKPEGSEILILTDGEGSWHTSSGTDVINNSIVFHTIFFGVTSGNEFLKDLSVVTDGVWSYANNLEALLDFFETVGAVDSGSAADESFQVKSESVELRGSVSGSVAIDPSIGQNTVFTFSYSGNYAPYVDLEEPGSGRRFCSGNHFPSGCDASLTGSVDDTFKTITFKIPGVAVVGSWKYEMTPTTSYATTVTASVSSMATAEAGMAPITVKSGMSMTDIKAATPIVVYAQVTQGFSPILNAEVSATVTHPDGSTSQLLLMDEGAAPDVRKSDGVYSKYFLDYSTQGRYSVKVKVNGHGNVTANSTFVTSLTHASASTAHFNYGVVKPDGTIVLNQNFKTSEIKYEAVDASDLDIFERVQSLGGFEYTGPSLSDLVDLFPPSKVIDLKAEQVNMDNVEEGFRLSFTASGDDYDKGIASRYELHYTFDETSRLVSDFESLPLLTNDSVLAGGDLNAPKSPGSLESFTVDISDLPETMDQVIKVGFAVRVYDEAGNSGEVSNVALLNLFLVSPAQLTNPCIDEDGNINVGSLFPVPGNCHKFYHCDTAGNPVEKSCPNGLMFDPVAGVCNWEVNVDCTDPDSSSSPKPCKNEDGSFDNSFFVDPATCKAYQCSNGYPYEFLCPDGLVFNPDSNICDWPSNVEPCVPDPNKDPLVPDQETSNDASSTAKPTSEPSYVTTTESDFEHPDKTTIVTDHHPDTHPNTTHLYPEEPEETTYLDHKDPVATTTVVNHPIESTYPDTITSSYPKLPNDTTQSHSKYPDGTTVAYPVDETTNTDTTVKPNTATTATTQAAKAPSFVGFVIDDTGSMSNEIEAVKVWLTNCVNGSYADCAIAPTGGWILTTFNDPTIGDVVGPTTDLSAIIDEINKLNAHGGGDCPERAFTGLLAAVSAVEEANSDCKIFFFSDAIGNDEGYYTQIKEQFTRKGCTYIPMLTGCCGTCSDPCLSTDPEYCINKVVDKTTTTLSFSAKSSGSGEDLFYDLASSSGGKIYLTDKPDSPDDFLEFLEEEITLGFCPTDLIAGPPPLGYANEADCNFTGSCWDRSQGMCFCQSSTEPCPKDPIPTTPPPTTPSPTPTCPPNTHHSFMPDPLDCSKYYECSNGHMWSRDCAPGTVFDEDLSVCNHPALVKPPCGTGI